MRNNDKNDKNYKYILRVWVSIERERYFHYPIKKLFNIFKTRCRYLTYTNILYEREINTLEPLHVNTFQYNFEKRKQSRVHSTRLLKQDTTNTTEYILLNTLYFYGLHSNYVNSDLGKEMNKNWKIIDKKRGFFKSLGW
jgi:hypothetical protein